MQVWILRHGEASWQASSDALRPLTDQGRADNAALAKVLAEQGVDCDFVIHSPYLRAVQTTEQIAPAVGLVDQSTWHESELFCPDVKLGECLHFLERFIVERDCQRLLLVGHNPLFSSLATDLSDQRVSLGTSNLCQIEFREVFAPSCGDLMGLRCAPDFQLRRF